MTCKQCGANLSADAKFCPECGARVEEAPSYQSWDAPAEEPAAEEPVFAENRSASAGMSVAKALKKASYGKGRIAILAAAVLAVVVIAGCAAALLLNKPQVLVAKAITNTANDVQKNFAGGILEMMGENGSVIYSADLRELGVSDADADVQAGLYYDTKKEESALQIAVNEGGEAVLSFSAYANENAYVLESPELCASAYGIDRKNAAEDLANSIFATDSGSSYSLDEETYSELLSVLQMDNPVSGEAAEMLKDYATDAASSVLKYADIDKSSEKLDVGSDTISTTAVTMTLTPEQLAKVAREMYDKAASDKDLKAALMDSFDTMNSVSSYGYESGEAFYDDFMARLGEQVDELEESCSGDMGDAALVMTFYVTKSGKTLAAVTLDVLDTSGSSSETIEFVLGESISKTEQILLRMTSGGYEIYGLDVEIRENSSDTYAADLTVTEFEEDIAYCSFTWNKKNGAFTLGIMDTADFTGTMEKSGKEVVITLETVSNGYETLNIPMTVALEGDVSVPSAPDYINAFTLTESDINALSDEITGNLYGMVNVLYEVFGNLYNMV